MVSICKLLFTALIPLIIATHVNAATMFLRIDNMTITTINSGIIVYDFEDTSHSLDNFSEYISFPNDWKYYSDSGNTLVQLEENSDSINFITSNTIENVQFNLSHNGNYIYNVNYSSYYSPEYSLQNFGNNLSINIPGYVTDSSGKKVFLDTIFFRPLGPYDPPAQPVPLPGSALILSSALITILGMRKFKRL